MGRFGSEMARKGVHVTMGGFALLLRWLTPAQAAAAAAVAVAFNVLVLHRVTRRALLRHDERERGFSWGVALYPTVVLVTIVVFHRRLELAAAVWALLAFGDGMATVAGVLLRGPRLPWNPDKSWSGFAAFVVWGTATSAFLLRWTQQAALDGPVAWVGDSFLGVVGGMSPESFVLAGCFAAALAAAMAESLRTGLNDNITVPLVGAAVLWAATLVEPGRLVAQSAEIGTSFAVGAAVNAALALAALAARGVGPSGALVGWGMGTLVYGFAGWPGFLMLLVFFVLGTVTTKLGHARKRALGIAQERGGRRGAANALANVGVGVILAFLAAATSYGAACLVALAAAFATAACDTVSSEIGQAYGRHTWLITRFRRVPPGTDGAVSVEGTLAGVAAAALVAVAALASGLVDAAGAGIVVVSGFVGATAESYAGALAVERMRRIDNEVVNFANTVVGALVALGLLAIVR